MSVIQKPRQGVKLLQNSAAAMVRHLRYAEQYGLLAPRPYEIIRVDPADIEHCTLPSLQAQLSLSNYGSHVAGGEWDRRDVYDDVWFTRKFDEPVRATFEDHALYRAMEAHFCDGVPWEATDWYQWICEHPGRVGQYPDEERMQARLREVDTLFENIESGGYRTQRELRRGDANDIPLYSRPFPFPEHYEVDVNIGRDGELLFNFNGRHRLAIAKILSLETIPVRVFVRHEQWQQRRQRAARRASGTDTAEHPDLSHQQSTTLLS
jgi:hypothetical protein